MKLLPGAAPNWCSSATSQRTGWPAQSWRALPLESWRLPLDSDGGVSLAFEVLSV